MGGKVFCLSRSLFFAIYLVTFVDCSAMQGKMFHKLCARNTRSYQGDPIGTAEKLVDWLVGQAPTIVVQKLPEPYTNDGLVLEIRGQVIYQFITPGGTLRISGLPVDYIGTYTWPGFMLGIIRKYCCEIKSVYSKPTNRYLIFNRDFHNFQLNSFPIIPGYLY